MSRDDLLNTNFKIMSDVVQKVVAQSPECILIIVSNPLDAMAQAAYRQAGFNRERVIGMAGVLDSARFRSFIAAELNVRAWRMLTAFVLGGHGDTWCAGALLDSGGHSHYGVDCARSAGTDRAADARWRGGDREYLKTAAPTTAPSAAVTEMVEAILKDKKKILPCAAYLEGEYGHRGLLYRRAVQAGAQRDWNKSSRSSSRRRKTPRSRRAPKRLRSSAR